MSTEVAIYVCAFLGMTGIMGVFALMIYRKHQRQLQQNLAHIQVIHDRRQQAIDLNLPPFYVDHVRDLVVHDHAPSLEAVMVEAGNGQVYNPSSISSLPSSSPASTSGPFTIVATDLESNSGGRESILPPLTRPRIVTLSSATSPSVASALATAQISSPSLAPVVPEEIDLSDLPPPPSYDVPNIVVERSPTLEPSPTSGSIPALSLALGSNASALSLSLSPSLTATSASIASTMERNEANSSSLGVTNNSRYSETEPIQGQPSQSNQQDHLQQRQPSAIAFETPRYSAEFDPNVPHEVHLQQYRRARALSDSSSRPSLASITQLSSGPSIVVVPS